MRPFILVIGVWIMLILSNSFITITRFSYVFYRLLLRVKCV